MPITPETAVRHYALFDRRVTPQREPIVRNLRRLEAAGFHASETLDSIVKNAYLCHEGLLWDSAKSQEALRPITESSLDEVFTSLTSSDLRREDLLTFQARYRQIVRSYSLAPGFPPAEDRLDLDTFEDRIFIGTLAFWNWCHNACLHCGNAGQWDKRQHTLDQLKEARNKMRFPANSYLNITHQEPFALPFLLDAVKYLLDEGALVGVVTSGLGVSATRRAELFKGLQYFHDNYSQRVAVDLSFDLFRRREINDYLALIADSLNRYPVIELLKFNYHGGNRAESVYRLKQLLRQVTRPAAREMVAEVLDHEEGDHSDSLVAPIGRAMGFNPADALAYIEMEHDTFFTEQRLSPHATNFMLFPGGGIVPNFCGEAPQIRSLGNIFEDSPGKIYTRYEEFVGNYRARLAKGIIPYRALVATEIEMRVKYGLPWQFVNHYDILEASLKG